MFTVEKFEIIYQKAGGFTIIVNAIIDMAHCKKKDLPKNIR